MLGLGIDVFEVVDADRLTALLEAVGPIEVEDATLDAADAGKILTARDPSVPAIEQYPAATAVWSGIAAAMSEEGSGSVASASAGDLTVDAVLGRALRRIGRGPRPSCRAARCRAKPRGVST